MKCCCKTLKPTANVTVADFACFSTDDSSLKWVWGRPEGSISGAMSPFPSGNTIVATHGAAPKRWFLDAETGATLSSEPNTFLYSGAADFCGFDSDGNSVALWSASSNSWAGYKKFDGTTIIEESFPRIVPYESTLANNRSSPYGFGASSNHICQIQATATTNQFEAIDHTSGNTIACGFSGTTLMRPAFNPYHRFYAGHAPLADASDELLVSFLAQSVSGSIIAVFRPEAVTLHGWSHATPKAVALAGRKCWALIDVYIECVEIPEDPTVNHFNYPPGWGGDTWNNWRAEVGSEVGTPYMLHSASGGDAVVVGLNGIARLPTDQYAYGNISWTHSSFDKKWVTTALTICESAFPSVTVPEFNSAAKIAGGDFMVSVNCSSSGQPRSVIARINSETGAVMHSKAYMRLPNASSIDRHGLRYAGGNSVLMIHGQTHGLASYRYA